MRKLISHIKKVKFNYFIVRPKVDQRAGLLSLPHLGIFAIHTKISTNQHLYLPKPNFWLHLWSRNMHVQEIQ